MIKNLGKWTFHGFRFQIGKREITWHGWARPISRKKAIRIGQTILYTRGPFAIFLEGKK